ncbi:MAG: hypothetical protein QOJ29_1504 [Thermoleophilaceae bacterium]|nr:hypothetical protein [Thermoleophilaceae bacterium]
MHKAWRLSFALFALAGAICPAAAHAADPSWSCGATTGWLAANGQRANAPSIGGAPCATAASDAAGVTGAPGNLAATGSLSVDGGTSSQTTDARRPTATVSAKSLALHNADGKLVLTASGLNAQAAGSCDSKREPAFTSSGDPGSVTLNGRTIDTRSEYSEPGIGVNGAPLFGKITIRFNEVTRETDGISRRAIHVIVTDRNGAVIFEAAAGDVAVGRSGAVCDPPPVCPAGQEPQAGRCVEVTGAPLPPPPPPAPPLPSTPGTAPGQPNPTPAPQQPSRRGASGCRDAEAKAGQVSNRRLAAATLCLLNVERKRHHLGKLDQSATLRRAALRHAADMVKRRYFSHTEPDGLNVVDRILHSGYLGRFGNWRIGENLGWGWGRGATPRSIVTAWMKSKPHRRNILGRSFHDVGVAVATGSPRRNRSGSITYVIDFGGFQLVR